MGNGNGKLKSKLNLLTNDEIKVVQTSFKHISKNTSKIKDDDLVVSFQLTIANSI